MDELLKDKLNQETAKIRWIELQVFFARGVAVYISEQLDLVDAAAGFSLDDTSTVGRWMDAGLVDKVSDKQATEWIEKDAMVWAVVVKPWVLVQPLDRTDDENPPES